MFASSKRTVIPALGLPPSSTVVVKSRVFAYMAVLLTNCVSLARGVPYARVLTSIAFEADAVNQPESSTGSGSHAPR